MSEQIKSFDAYCKSVLRHAASNAHRGRKRTAAKIIPFSALSVDELAQLIYRDQYPFEIRTYHTFGREVEITDDQLQAALERLSQNQRDVLLLSACFDMTDAEIAQLLGVSRSTVQYRRSVTVQFIRKYLEGNHEDHS